MADCDDTLRELEAFLDTELSPAAHHVIQEHLDGCLHCLHAFDFEAELRQVIAKKCSSDEMPAGLMDKIQACFGDLDDEPETSDSPG
jgi:mycothiol system anti-sigma-R factor